MRASSRRGIDALRHYSCLQALRADQAPGGAAVGLEDFRGETVLVGVTFTGNTDGRPTPISKAYPPNGVLGNAISNILRRDFVHRASLPSRLVAALLPGGATAFRLFLLRHQ